MKNNTASGPVVWLHMKANKPGPLTADKIVNIVEDDGGSIARAPRRAEPSPCCARPPRARRACRRRARAPGRRPSRRSRSAPPRCFPSAGAWAAMAARVLTRSPHPVHLVPRGSTPATAAAARCASGWRLTLGPSGSATRAPGFDPERASKIASMNGREGRGSGLWLKASVAPIAVIHLGRPKPGFAFGAVTWGPAPALRVARICSPVSAGQRRWGEHGRARR